MKFKGGEIPPAPHPSHPRPPPRPLHPYPYPILKSETREQLTLPPVQVQSGSSVFVEGSGPTQVGTPLCNAMQREGAEGAMEGGRGAAAPPLSLG